MQFYYFSLHEEMPNNDKKKKKRKNRPSSKLTFLNFNDHTKKENAQMAEEIAFIWEEGLE